MTTKSIISKGKRIHLISNNISVFYATSHSSLYAGAPVIVTPERDRKDYRSSCWKRASFCTSWDCSPESDAGTFQSLPILFAEISCILYRHHVEHTWCATGRSYVWSRARNVKDASTRAVHLESVKHVRTRGSSNVRLPNPLVYRDRYTFSKFNDFCDFRRAPRSKRLSNRRERRRRREFERPCTRARAKRKTQSKTRNILYTILGTWLSFSTT